MMRRQQVITVNRQCPVSWSLAQLRSVYKTVAKAVAPEAGTQPNNVYLSVKASGCHV